MKTGGSSQHAWMEVDESVKKGKERAAPTYKKRSDIEQMIDLRKVLEEKVLDSHVDLTLRELLGIAKKEFHDTIVDLIKRKRQQSDEEEVKTSAITMAKSEEEEEEEVMADNHSSRPHWTRVTTEMPVKIVLGNMSLRMEPDARCGEPAHRRTGPDWYRPIGRTEM